MNDSEKSPSDPGMGETGAQTQSFAKALLATKAICSLCPEGLRDCATGLSKIVLLHPPPKMA